MTWTDHLIIQCLDIIKLFVIPALGLWFFKKPFKKLVRKFWRNGAV